MNTFFYRKYLTLIIILVFTASCFNEDDLPPKPESESEPIQTGLDLAQFNNGNGVMMQAFYWDVNLQVVGMML